jgi:hypothetical protein
MKDLKNALSRGEQQMENLENTLITKNEVVVETEYTQANEENQAETTAIINEENTSAPADYVRKEDPKEEEKTDESKDQTSEDNSDNKEEDDDKKKEAAKKY